MNAGQINRFNDKAAEDPITSPSTMNDHGEGLQLLLPAAHAVVKARQQAEMQAVIKEYLH